MELKDVKGKNQEELKASFLAYLDANIDPDDLHGAKIEIVFREDTLNGLVAIGLSEYEHWNSSVEDTHNLDEIVGAGYDAEPGIVKVYRIQDTTKIALAVIRLWEEREGVEHHRLLVTL